ncbi:MAG: hypothetical protein CO186_10835 [Zetaproteobacteria bacterium CG_4_9_14_3_um_filter_49_83]|nr:MAG: hypothetical protein AUJ56_09225 [Zetaproteobacteria bacterium CG1_02_49_23]PIQ33335.1 MAG: hypothetical protein COW62_05700 [Zetaproteobacteria bacterium CG17_big_fil_post_rev_8_21_14_2_50_50_13]PIV31060.1 MAG: hypothetical protein COS35_03400 [Zetaproteobacteria bacterium CG02_land_8_20_14_3_00_50_9]PIY57071.1 MAG: hypothetical protein COZ00_00880 [Zetaproteobacteria bacterium CG_4_10_14_0_8_um_filter_49_80]PJA34389.1 MAG: hypothetical protein CO186_10835 [Zetaproteobacteria bacterium
MSEGWSENELNRTVRMFKEKKYHARNGKVHFKNLDKSTGFIFEAEMEKVQYRMHPFKDSHTFVEYESLEAMMAAGWVSS